MANLLADPLLWHDDSGPPPESWNGFSYSVSYGAELFRSFYLVLENPPPPGDVISGTVTINHESDINTATLYLFDADGETLDSLDVALGVPTQFDFSAAGAFRLFVGPAYSQNVTITPGSSPAPVDCEELGRTTRAYVSGYQRDRIHLSRLVRGEKRCLVANFNGAIPVARTIASATWRCDLPYAVAMANGRIIENNRSTAVDITAQYGRFARIKCQVTLDNGEVYNQLFVVRVQNSPWFQGEVTPAAGPYDLTVTA